ncbi:MAG: HxlR family transcriptional regulator [Proteobacteria bacterium SG_bin9]|nr:MAG: HxlR family transcriptional regulator [Proteobacteria bacterium SG_bin9]
MPLKIRKNKSLPHPSACPIGECMSLLGGAWTSNIVWHLSGGPRRFGELRVDIPPISPKMLSARLKSLEQKGVVRRELIDTSPPSAEYSLTDLGRELVPAISAIVSVGERLKRQEARAGDRKLKVVKGSNR